MTAADVDMNEFQNRLAALERRIAGLSSADIDVDGYFRVFLEEVVAVLGEGGGVWEVAEGVEARCVHHMNLGLAGLEQEGRQHELVSRAVAKVIQTGSSVVLAGNDGANLYDGGLTEETGNDSPYTLLVAPMAENKRVVAVLVLISPEGVDPRAVRGYMGFLLGLCDQAGGFLQRKRIEDLQGQMGRSQRLREYVSALHSSLDPRRTCYALANYGQELLGVYRCMAGSYNAWGKFRMEAVSGLESVAVKSSFIKAISQIAREVCVNGKVLLVENPAEAKVAGDDADEILTAARLYMLQAETKVMGVFPVKSGNDVVGALVVEKADEEPIDQTQRRQVEALLGEAGTALNNGLAYRNLPLSPLVRGVGALRRKIFRMPRLRLAIWVVILAVVLSLPFVIRKQVKVIGTAELVPVAARTVYAQRDGDIERLEIPAGQDQLVNEGDVLAVMDMLDIDRKLDFIQSQISEKTLARKEANLRRDYAEEQLLDRQLKTLEAERQMYLVEREKYQVRAVVAGQIITPPAVLRLLQGKPVARGDAILEIVPQDTSWELSVNVPEDEAGPLLQAYDDPERKEPLVARIILNVNPSLKLRAEVISVAPRAYVMDAGEHKYRNVIEVRVSQPEGFLEQIDPRQGMEGKVAIECGRRSVYYGVTREFADFLRVNLF